MKSLIIFVLVTRHEGNQLKEVEVGGACNLLGRDMKCIADINKTAEGRRSFAEI